MVDSCNINIDGIGPILMEHRKRTRRVIISIKPSKGIRVSVPEGVSFKKAEEFVYSKTDWIQRHLEKIKQYENKRKTIPDASLDIDRVEAKERLTTRLNRLAEKHGFTYNKVSIRSQKSRWGSCSHRNNISLNIKLVLLPKELMDYVILHELVHSRIHNHTKRF